jgi:acetyltransferase EpsM
VVADIVRQRGDYSLVGFLDDLSPHRKGTELAGLPILGGRESLPLLRQAGVHHLIVGVGDCPARLRLAEHASAQGFLLATAVHPKAIVADDVPIGPGTVIAAGAVVNPGARIGENVIVNTAASVDHESVVESGAHVSPGAHLAGRVTIGRATWIGIGAAIIEGIHVGAHSIVGAGAVVLTDIPDSAMAYGVPARVVRTL